MTATVIGLVLLGANAVFTLLRGGLAQAILATSVLTSLLMLSNGYGEWLPVDGRAFSLLGALILTLHVLLSHVHWPGQAPGPHTSSQSTRLVGWLAASFAISALWSLQLYETLSALLAVLCLLLLVYVTRRLPGEECLRTLRTLVATVVITNLVCGIGIPSLGVENNRMRGFFDNANELAAFTVIAAALLMSPGERARWIIFWGALTGTTILLTGSRGAILAFLILALISIHLRSSGRGYEKAIKLTAIGVVGITALSQAPRIFANLQTLGFQAARTNNSREAEWSYALESIGGLMPLGSGYSALSLNPFNSYMKIVGELGLLGLVLCVAFLAVALSMARSRLRWATPMIVAAAVSALFESWLFTMGSGIALLFWLSLTLTENENLNETNLVRQ